MNGKDGIIDPVLHNFMSPLSSIAEYVNDDSVVLPSPFFRLEISGIFRFFRFDGYREARPACFELSAGIRGQAGGGTEISVAKG